MTSGSTSDVRAWAREQGLQVGDRGRLPAEVLEQYAAAKGKPKAKRAATTLKTAKKATVTGAAPSRREPAVREPKPRVAAPAKRSPVSRQVSAPSEPRPAAPAPVPSRVDELPASTAAAGAVEQDGLRAELDRVREQVAVLRQELDDTKGRVSELEQRRGLFNRSGGRRS